MVATAHKRTNPAGDDPKQRMAQYRRRIIDHREVPAEQILLNPLNPRRHPRAQTAAVRSSLHAYGWVDEVKVRQLPNGQLRLIDGEDRTKIAAGQMVPCAVLDLTDEEELELLATFDAMTLMAVYDDERSAELAALVADSDAQAATLLRAVSAQNAGLDLLRQLEQAERADTTLAPLGGTFGDSFEDDGTERPEVGMDAGDDESPDLVDERTIGDASSKHAAALTAKFGAPPFTVLDTRQGYWQERKRAWLALGIESELGRDVAGENIRFGRGAAMKRAMRGEGREFAAGGGNEAPALSVFDPVLTELAAIDVAHLTPIEALNLLAKWQQHLST